MVSNRALEKLGAGQPSFGLAMAMKDPIVAEYLGRSGIDWIWIDEQHGSLGYEAMGLIIQAIGFTGTAPIVRLGSNEFFRIGRALDAGALGLIVPMVNSVEEAEAAVHAAKYPPQGGRSSGGPRLALLGSDYAQEANDNTLLAVMIETRRALEAAGDIAAVEGVDCLFIGPSDLSMSLGASPGSDEHEGAITEILEQATAAGKFAGIACGSVEDALMRAEQGFRFPLAGSELGMIRRGIAHAQEALELTPGG